MSKILRDVDPGMAVQLAGFPGGWWMVAFHTTTHTNLRAMAIDPSDPRWPNGVENSSHEIDPWPSNTIVTRMMHPVRERIGGVGVDPIGGSQ